MAEKREEFLAVRSEVRLPWKECAGQYLTKFLMELRDNAKIIGNRCPQCGRISLPPNIVCGWCKIRIEDKPENWVELSDNGTVGIFLEITDRDTEPLTGELLGLPNPGAQILLDGGDENCFLYHILEELDISKVHRGMRVQAVWKPREERRGMLSDIRFFRTIEDK